MNPEIVYLSDDSIDDAGDRELRGLLTTCFTKPQDVVFRTQRYFREPYRHRWVIRNAQGALIAHVGVHEKTVEADGKAFRIGGICEVCVHPDYRGKGHVRSMLEYAHAWLSEHGIPFSVLFGDPKVYDSSGYVEVDNLYANETGNAWQPVKGMMNEMPGAQWPQGDVHLVGPKF